MPKTKKEPVAEKETKKSTVANKTTKSTSKTTKTATKKPAKTKTAKKEVAKKQTAKQNKVAKKPAKTATKVDEKLDAILQIIANLKTENVRLTEWLQNRKLSKKEKEKIEENIAFNENAIKHFYEIIK